MSSVQCIDVTMMKVPREECNQVAREQCREVPRQVEKKECFKVTAATETINFIFMSSFILLLILGAQRTMQPSNQASTAGRVQCNITKCCDLVLIISYMQQVPVQECQEVPRQVPKQVEKEVCNDIPRQVINRS